MPCPDPHGMVACPQCGHEFTVEPQTYRLGDCPCCGDSEKEIQIADNPDGLCVDCLEYRSTVGD